MGHDFFSRFFVGYKKKEIYILQNKTKQRKKKKERRTKRSGNWDLISFPHCSFVIGFTDVCTHTFMLNCRLYNTWVSVHFCFSIIVVLTIFVRRTIWQHRLELPFHCVDQNREVFTQKSSFHVILFFLAGDLVWIVCCLLVFNREEDVVFVYVHFLNTECCILSTRTHGSQMTFV